MKSLFLILGTLALVVVLSNAAALDDYDQELRDEEERYLMDLENILAHGSGRLEKSKRARFCLNRDMTCPNFKNGRDLCCHGSQCACNIFGQNCRCSSLGLFQRLGRR